MRDYAHSRGYAPLVAARARDTGPFDQRKAALTAFRRNVGEKVRLARKMRQLSAEQVADRSGLSKGTVTAIERGADASTSSLALIAAALDCDVQDFIGPIDAALARSGAVPSLAENGGPQGPEAAEAAPVRGPSRRPVRPR